MEGTTNARMQHLSDEQIVNIAQSATREALAEMAEDNSFNIADYPQIEIDDLQQYAALGATEAAKNFDPTKGKLTTHIYQRAKYSLYHGLDHELRQIGREITADTLAMCDRMPDPSSVDECGEAEPPRSLLSHAERERVRGAVSRLGDDDRDVLQLVYYDGCTTREAADTLGVDHSTVVRRRDLALKRLAVELARGDEQQQERTAARIQRREAAAGRTPQQRQREQHNAANSGYDKSRK